MQKKEAVMIHGYPLEFFQEIDYVKALVSQKSDGNMKTSANGGADNQIKFMRFVCHEIHGARQFIIKVAHGNKVGILNGNSGNDFLSGKDAIITQNVGDAIGVTYADCPPVLFAAKTTDEKPTVAAAHSGWRSTLAKICPNTVDEIANFRVERERLKACIAPGISFRRFEFGEDAPEVFTEYPGFVKKINSSKKYRVDIKGIIKWQLIHEAGLLEENIEDSEICTYETPTLFSDRRDNKGKKKAVEAGIAIIVIKPSFRLNI
jgi:YfiH family protein